MNPHLDPAVFVEPATQFCVAGSTKSPPRVVAIGGGHGLAVTLRAAKAYATTLTAVVSVADDGGSSGKLRATTGLPAMGDIRRCLSALADPQTLGDMFEHRFADDLEGHALGNLVIAALAQRIGFAAAIAELGRLLAVGADILPTTEQPIELVALTDRGLVHGQVAAHCSTGIKRITVEPSDATPTAAALEAIAAADQIVLGPGSLFTSVLAALAVPGIAEAVTASPGRVVYVCNLRPEVPEAAGFDVDAHVDALRDHGVDPDDVVADGSLARDDGRAHDPARLGAALAALLGAPGPPG